MTLAGRPPEDDDRDEADVDALAAEAIGALADIAETSRRLSNDGVDETAALVQRIRIANEFTRAEERERLAEPDPLSGYPESGAHRYRAEDDGDGEWIASNVTVAVGGGR